MKSAGCSRRCDCVKVVEASLIKASGRTEASGVVTKALVRARTVFDKASRVEDPDARNGHSDALKQVHTALNHGLGTTTTTTTTPSRLLRITDLRGGTMREWAAQLARLLAPGLLLLWWLLFVVPGR